MAGRYEGGEVVATVRVPLEDLRADHLAHGRDQHERGDPRAIERVQPAAGEQQRSPGDGADRGLAGRVGATVDQERRDDVNGRGEGEAAGAGERAAYVRRACAGGAAADHRRTNVRGRKRHAGRILPGPASTLGGWAAPSCSYM